MRSWNVSSPRRRVGLTLALLFAISGAGCATGGGGGGGSSSAGMIVRTQFEGQGLGTAYDVVSRFRSSWLRPRNRQGDLPIVVLDSVRLGDVESLRTVRATDVESIEYISGTQATTVYGTGAMGGVIHVVTR